MSRLTMDPKTEQGRERMKIGFIPSSWGRPNIYEISRSRKKYRIADAPQGCQVGHGWCIALAVTETARTVEALRPLSARLPLTSGIWRKLLVNGDYVGWGGMQIGSD